MSRTAVLLVQRTGLCLLLAAGFALATPSRIDPVASQVGFILQTRWGQTLEGRFPKHSGDAVQLTDGRHQVRLRLSTREVEIAGHPAYTRFTRGEGFFDAAHWPYVEFVSDGYGPALLRDGGSLGGTLSIRGIRRHETFQILPTTCARPGFDCDVVVNGSIRRSDYDMSRWDFALSGRVGFSLRIRLLDAQVP